MIDLLGALAALTSISRLAWFAGGCYHQQTLMKVIGLGEIHMNRSSLGFGIWVWVLLAIPSLAEDWPQWRGPNRDDVSQEKGLLQEWPEAGPERVWLFSDAGIGYSGFSVVGDTLYTMGARDGRENLIAIAVENGRQKWATEISTMLENGYGNGPRGTPTVDGDRIYAMSGTGTLVCAKAADGGIVWTAEMAKFGGKRPGWGYCESVLVDGDQVVCTPGGSQGAVVALNKSSGDLIWQSKDFAAGAQYASIIIAEHNGKRQYIQLVHEKVVGLNSENGSVLWSSDWHGRTATVPTPIFHDGYVYITSGYNSGCKLVKLEADGTTTDVYDDKTMVNHHGGVVLVGDHLYGFSDGKGWICQDFKTGEMVWNERAKLGKGCLTYADGRLYLLDERKGTVALIEPSPDGYNEHGRFTLEPLSQQRSKSGGIWTHPVIANGKLFLRDQEFIYCFDVRRPLAGGG